MDLLRVDYYSRRVRHIDFDGNDKALVSSHIWSSLHELRRFRLFPSLQSVGAILHTIPFENLSCLLLVVSPTLSTVVLTALSPLNKAHAATFLSHLCSIKSWPLQDLTVKGDINAHFFRPLQGFEIPKIAISMDLDKVLTKALHAAFNIAKVQPHSLTLYFCDADNEVDYPPMSMDAPASTTRTPYNYKLKTLSVHGLPFQLSAFTDKIECAWVTELSFNFEYDTTLENSVADDWLQEQCFMNAAKHMPSVESCSITSNCQDFGKFPWRALDHVEDWKYLKKLDIDALEIIIPPGDYDHSDRPGGLWRFRRWNSLESLCIRTSNWTCTRTPRDYSLDLTPLDLPSIADCCPKLQELRIQVYFPLREEIISQIHLALNPSCQPSPIPAAAPHGLKRLHFSGITWEEEENGPYAIGPHIQIAHETILPDFLVSAFPDLESVIFNSEEWSGSEHTWCMGINAIMEARLDRKRRCTSNKN